HLHSRLVRGGTVSTQFRSRRRAHEDVPPGYWSPLRRSHGASRLAGGASVEPRSGMSPGFTLMELLVATALIGVIALAAAAFSKDIFAVQHRLTTEYYLRMEGLRAMEEIREGFSSGGTRYGGVRQAEEVVVLAGGKRSEERRVGKEGRCGGAREQWKQ